jgi:hypothetical protein
MPLVTTEAQQATVRHRVATAILEMLEMMKVEESGRAATRHDALEVVAVEDLAPDRSQPPTRVATLLPGSVVVARTMKAA